MKEEVIKEVTSCSDCPFKVYEFHGDIVGRCDIYYCSILQKEWIDNIIYKSHKPKIDYEIPVHKNGTIKTENKRTLNNCPLLNIDLKITLK